MGNNMFERISLRPHSSLDDISDCVSVDGNEIPHPEVSNVCGQRRPPPHTNQVHQALHGFSPRRPPSAGTPRAVGGETPRVHASPRDRGASEAWGGAQGFQRAPSKGKGGDSVVESVAEIGNNRPDTYEAPPFSARKPRASLNFDVRVSTPEGVRDPAANVIVPNSGSAAPPETGGRRGRRWTKMFGGNGSAGNQQHHAQASPSPAAELRRRPPLQPQQAQDEVAPFSMD